MKIPPERLIPANGVYVTRALISNQWYKSVTSIGVRPTFENPLPEPRVEPYILDVKGDFYGQPIQLDFLTFLRPEIKFPDAQSLIEQIKLDVEKAREVLSNDE
jgi:riboflavin kinase/FMN adenylyltransferase